MSSQTLRMFINEYLLHCQGTVKQATVIAYTYDLNIFETWLTENLPVRGESSVVGHTIESVTCNLITQFLRESMQTLKYTTACRRRGSIRAFFTHLESAGMFVLPGMRQKGNFPSV